MKKLFFALISAALLLVSCDQEKEIVVSSVTVTPSTLALYVDEVSILQVSVLPENAVDREVKWSSQLTSVATVSPDGMVTAMGEGTTVISAKAGGITGTCTVTVTKKFIAVESVTMEPESIALIKGERAELSARVLPVDATDKTVTWSSSDDQVVTVEGNGSIVAVGGGEAVITATAGQKSASCQVSVTVPVESVTLDRETLTLVEEESATLVATVLPEDASDKSVSWESSAPEVACVDENGLVQALKYGKAVISAKSGDCTGTCTVTVEKKFIPVTSISLDKTSLPLIKGESATLKATVAPDDATDPSVKWSSSNAAVASVDANGKVTAMGGGSAVITATAGEKSATCNVTVTVPVSGVQVDPTQISLEEDQTAVLKATVLPADATDQSVTWSSSNSSVVNVNANGQISALKTGTATITVKASGKTATCAVTVTPKPIPVTSVSLNKKSLSLTKGDSASLIVTVRPMDATDPTVTWSSSNPAVASVSANGKVTAVGGGEAVITAQAGNCTATCDVSVTVNVETLKLNYSTFEMPRGTSFTLVATVGPEDATNKEVTWSSTNSSILTVDQNGVVNAVKNGKATVNARCGKLTASCQITVTVPVESITLSPASLSVDVGSSATVSATVTPSNATNKYFTWTSADPSIATVSAEGVITGVKKGTTTITASSGDVSASCKVTVNLPVSSVELNHTSLTITKGETAQLTATVLPDDATDKTVTWSTSDKSVATVDANGLVTALKGGSVRITARAGQKSAVCNVEVYAPVQGVTLNHSSIVVGRGSTTKLTATVQPSDATDKSVTWSSQDPSVATVSSTGVVTGVKKGNTVITADASGFKATCKVEVNVPVTSLELSATAISLSRGSSQTLIATVGPDDADDPTVTWTSSNSNVASVDANGKVTAVAAGTAQITATAGSLSRTCSVSVYVPVSSVTLNQTSASVEEGKTLTLTATVNPSDATDKTVTWTTSDKTVATVSGGVVTALKLGVVTISAKAGEHTASCQLTVTEKNSNTEDFGEKEGEW